MAYICKNRPFHEGGCDHSGTRPTSAVSNQFQPSFGFTELQTVRQL